MKKINYIILLVTLFGCNNSDYKFVVLKDGIQKDFVEAALERTKHQIIYNGNYFNIDYPNGDIPEKFGVCTDVIVRSYRKINVDLQQLLHEDIKKNFNDKLEIEGVVLTMHDKRNSLSDLVENDVRGHFGKKVYKTIIPRNVRVSEAPSHGKPVLLYDTKCYGSKAYAALSAEVILQEEI